MIDIDDAEAEKPRSSIMTPFGRLRQESIISLQDEEVDSAYEELPRPSLFVPFRRLSQNLEQALANFFQTQPDSNEESTKVDHIKLKMSDVLNDEEELRRFKAFARNNCVTTNIGIQQMLLKYTKSHDTEVAEQTNHFAKRDLSRPNPQCNQYRVEKDEIGGYNWISAFDMKYKCEPIRRRASVNPSK